MESKICKQCEIEKPISEFSIVKSKYHRNICIQCRSKRGKEIRGTKKEHFRQYFSNWRKNNPLNTKIKQANGRAKKYNCISDGTITVESIRNLLEIQNNKCSYCSCDLKEDFQIDHKIPFSKKGSNTLMNIHLVCEKCNLEKGDKTHEQYLEWEKLH